MNAIQWQEKRCAEKYGTFTSPAKARKWLKQKRFLRGRSKKQYPYIYPCSVCGQYHLTKLTPAIQREKFDERTGLPKVAERESGDPGEGPEQRSDRSTEVTEK